MRQQLLLLAVAIVFVAGQSVQAEYIHAEKQCWNMSNCKSPPLLQNASKVNCYAYETECSPKVKFGFVSIPKRGNAAPSCSDYFDCLLDNKVQFCHSGLCRREGVELHHCERNLRNTRCFSSNRDISERDDDQTADEYDD